MKEPLLAGASTERQGDDGPGKRLTHSQTGERRSCTAVKMHACKLRLEAAYIHGEMAIRDVVLLHGHPCTPHLVLMKFVRCCAWYEIGWMDGMILCVSCVSSAKVR